VRYLHIGEKYASKTFHNFYPNILRNNNSNTYLYRMEQLVWWNVCFDDNRILYMPFSVRYDLDKICVCFIGNMFSLRRLSRKRCKVILWSLFLWTSISVNEYFIRHKARRVIFCIIQFWELNCQQMQSNLLYSSFVRFRSNWYWYENRPNTIPTAQSMTNCKTCLLEQNCFVSFYVVLRR
jgi:hypothetical protein